MNIRSFYCPILVAAILMSGCATTPSPDSGTLGKREIRNVVILGEHIPIETAKYYANKYNAGVLYSQSRGPIADAVSNSLRGTVGPSRAMRDIINELKSISNSEGLWKLIIPSSAEKYFLVTLRNIDDNAIANAHGQIILLESSANKEIEQEITRVFGNGFQVLYNR